MQTFSSKISFSIIAAGLFIVISFAALNYDHLSAPFYVVSGLLVAFIFLFGFAMGRRHSLPLKELLNEASKVAKTGKPSNTLQIGTKDELEELSKVFSKIASGFSEKSSAMDTLQKNADIKLKTKDLVSEKVIEVLEEKVRNRTEELDRVQKELLQTKAQLASLQKGKKKTS